MYSVVKTPESQAVDREKFRHVVGHFASGVTIVTARHADADFGLTASSVASLSLDPPMMLVCVNRQAGTCGAIVNSGRFAVNILREDQAALALQFSRQGGDKFLGVTIARSGDGLPLIPDALARIECRVVSSIDGGSHTVFLGEVGRAEALEGNPLVYYRGKMGQFMPGK